MPSASDVIGAPPPLILGHLQHSHNLLISINAVFNRVEPNFLSLLFLFDLVLILIIVGCHGETGQTEHVPPAYIHFSFLYYFK